MGFGLYLWCEQWEGRMQQNISRFLKVKKFGIAAISGFIAMGCVPKKVKTYDVTSGDVCGDISKDVKIKDAIETLNQVSLLYRSHCYSQVIAFGTQVRDKFSVKTFSITKETLEIVLPEGQVTDYALESYERSYLSMLIGLSYLHLGQRSEALPEINHVYSEETAQIYNHGKDPAIFLLQAELWDNFGSESLSSRPFWSWLNNNVDGSNGIGSFISDQIERIDASKEEFARDEMHWNVYEVGKFPEVQWSFSKGREHKTVYEFAPNSKFADSCASESVMYVNTESWLKKIAKRHEYDYHPIVNAKTWVRTPIGTTVAAAGCSAGIALIIGGCALDIASHGSGDVCGMSYYIGSASMIASSVLMRNMLAPDTRHWEDVPEGFLIVKADATEEDLKEDTCYASVGSKSMNPLHTP
jgi:hypothetical protein